MCMYIMTPNWKLPEYPLSSEWTDKKLYINMMEYYLAIEKRNSDNLKL